jgi:hypothetical protein
MTAKGHFAQDLAVLGVRVASCPGATGRIQPEFGVGANPFLSSMKIREMFPRNPRRIIMSKARRRRRWRTRPIWTGSYIGSPGRGMYNAQSRGSQDWRQAFAITGALAIGTAA